MKFIECLVAQGGHNIGAAYKKAYGTNIDRASAWNGAKRNLENPVIKQAFDKAMAVVMATQPLAADNTPFNPTPGIPIAPLHEDSPPTQTATPGLIAAQRYVISRQALAGNLVAIGYASITDIITWDEHGKAKVKASALLEPHVGYAIKRIKVSEKGAVEIWMDDRLTALRDLARLQGWLDEPDDGKPPPTEPELVERRKKVRDELYKMVALMARPAVLDAEDEHAGDAL